MRVKRHADRDKSLDAMLRRAVHTPDAAASSDCIDAETMAAWSERALPAGTLSRIETHLSQCSRCQSLLATLARSTPPRSASPSIWRRWHLRWIVPAAATASALALWIATPSHRSTPSTQPAVLNDSTASQSAVPSSPAPAARAEQQRDRAKTDVASRSDRSAPLGSARDQRALAKQEAPSATADSSAGAATPATPAREAEARSLQETITVAPALPAAPPAAERGELSAQAQAATVVEDTSPDPANRWRIVNRTRIERSTDSGANWQVVSFPEIEDLVAIRALSATRALVTTADGRRFRTDDRGRTWARVVP